MTILGIETSCDETGIGLLKDGKVVANIIASQNEIHSTFGGIVPELASRAHVERIDCLFTEAVGQGGITPSKIDYIGVTSQPGLKGALLAGVSFACGLAYALDIPIYKVNHLHAHLAVNFLDKRVKFPALGLIISGGHTAFFLINNPVEFKVIGKTLDDACGETFDKVGRMLELGFPGGPLIEIEALRGNENKIKFPVALMGKTSLDFSFSGLKTAVLYHLKENGLKEIPDICASFQRAVGDTLIEKTKRALFKYPVNSLLLGGGVIQNGYLRKRFQDISKRIGVPLFIPDKDFCMDNGGMTAVMTSFLIKHGILPSDNRIEVTPT